MPDKITPDVSVLSAAVVECLVLNFTAAETLQANTSTQIINAACELVINGTKYQVQVALMPEKFFIDPNETVVKTIDDG